MTSLMLLLPFFIGMGCAGENPPPGAPEEFTRDRQQMVQRQIAARGVRDSQILEAMKNVPRHLFVPSEYRHMAYKDQPLPIGDGQTISQPYIVAYMTEALELGPNDRVLEIGTGCGSQTAILAELSYKVYTVERIRSLMVRARKILADLEYNNILFKAFDGTLGWKEYAPFDAIMVTAGAPKLPRPLFEQLTDHGRMVIPVGNRFSQELISVTKRKGTYAQNSLGGCRFVNLIGIHGWNE